MKIEAGKWYETRGGDVVQAGKNKQLSETKYPFFYVRHGLELHITEDGFYWSTRRADNRDLIKEVAAPETKQEVKFVPTHVYTFSLVRVELRFIHKNEWASGKNIYVDETGSVYSLNDDKVAPYTPPHELDGYPVGKGIFVRDAGGCAWYCYPFKDFDGKNVTTYRSFSTLTAWHSWDEYRLTNPMLEGEE